MRIGICDDELIWQEKARQTLEEYIIKMKIEYSITVFSAREEILSYEGYPLDLIFMDIDLAEESGIEVAGRLNKKWPGCQIIYLTNYISYATEVYETKHTYFVLKKEMEERMAQVLKRACDKMAQKKEKIVLAVVGGEAVYLDIDDILYLERDRRYTLVHTVWGSYRVKEKLDELLFMLPETDFVRCHNSFVVHLTKMKEMWKDRFLLEDGQEIMISRRYLKKTKEAFAKWSALQIF